MKITDLHIDGYHRVVKAEDAGSGLKAIIAIEGKDNPVRIFAGNLPVMQSFMIVMPKNRHCA